MSKFTTPLRVEHIDGRMWKLLEEFSFWFEEKEILHTIIVPAGFKTDFASIPKLFWTIIGHPTGKYGKSAVVHDYLYTTQEYTRKKTDWIFLQGMKVLKVPWYQRRIMWLMVRAFAWLPWNRYRRKL